MNNEIIIFGSAEIAEIAKFYFHHDSPFKVVAFTVDDEFVREESLQGVPIIAFSEISRNFPSDKYRAHVALSYKNLNKLREEKYFQMKKKGYELISYISSSNKIWNKDKIGDNCLILENQTIQPSVTIGNNVMIWSGNHIGHGTNIGDHNYISSHVVFSGNCNIGKRNFFGVNSTIKDFCLIEDDCFVTMGSLISKDMKSGSVSIAKSHTEILTSDNRKAKTIKKLYFGN